MDYKFAPLLMLLWAPGLGAQPETPDALFQTGVNQLAAQNFAEAETAFRALRDREPGNVRGVVGVGQTLLAQRRMADALQYVTGEIAKDTSNPKLNLVLGDLAAQAGQFDIAVMRYERTLALLARDPDAATFFVKRSSKRFPDSTKDPLEAAMDNFIGNDATPAGLGGIHTRLAEAYLRMGNGQRGLQALENARRHFPSDPSIVLNLAMLYEIARNQPRAIAMYREVVKLVPDQPAALNNLAFLLAETGGDLDEALRHALRANQLAPMAREVIDTLGWVYFKRKAYGEAIQILARLVSGLPENAGYREHLRQALEQSGDSSEGVERLRAALQQPPGEASNRALSELIVKMYPEK